MVETQDRRERIAAIILAARSGCRRPDARLLDTTRINGMIEEALEAVAYADVLLCVLEGDDGRLRTSVRETLGQAKSTAEAAIAAHAASVLPAGTSDNARELFESLLAPAPAAAAVEAPPAAIEVL